MKAAGCIFRSSRDSPSSTCASHGSVCDLTSPPEATELDRILVKVTAVALDASVNIQENLHQSQQQQQPQPDVNANNEASFVQESLNLPKTKQTLADKKSKSLGRRFRLLFGLAPKVAKNDDEWDQPSQHQQQKKRRESRATLHRELQELRQRLFLKHQHQSYPPAEEHSNDATACREKKVKSASPLKSCREAGAASVQLDSTINSKLEKLRCLCTAGSSSGVGGELTPQPELINLSNTSTPKKALKAKKKMKQKKLQKQKKTKNAEQQQHQLPEQTQQHMQELQQQLQSQQQTSPESTMQSEPLPTDKVKDGAAGNDEKEANLASSPPPKTHVFRGGPTTAEHKRLRDAIFRECRIIPVDTVYKKVAMVPGRERLLLTAPSNPRSMGSPLLYDIAYENSRHHSDCNRDFVRVNLKKICSNYCRPSQFRYVY